MTDPSLDEMSALAQTARERLPEAFRKLSEDVLIRVVDWPQRDVLDELGIDHPLGLLGLYQGVDVTRKSLFDVAAQPDMVFLYREPILAFWREEGEQNSLEHIVTHVLVHEIGHHFGLSDEDMHAIEDAAGDD